MSRHLAANIGIPFYTPEEYFLKEAPRDYVTPFDPAGHLDSTANTGMYLPMPETRTLTATVVAITKHIRQDIVLFCGSPGAGKSTFYWKIMKPLGYERVNQDILKTVSMMGV